MAAAEQVQVQATAMASDGRAVGRLSDGKVVFVDGALPGETVSLVILTDRTRFADAEVAEVLTPSADRVDPPCPHFTQGCGGCQWQYASPAAQRRLKEQMIGESLRRIGHLDGVPMTPTIELPDENWRTTIRAGVRNGRAALRRTSSHDLVGVDGCLVAHPLLRPLLDGRRYGRAVGVLLRCGARTGEVLARPTPARAVIDVPHDVVRDCVHEVVDDRRWRISASSFFQSRPDGADALVTLVKATARDLAGGGRALDAYSGVGLFAGSLAATGWSVTAVEGSASSVADARVNLAGFGDQVEVVRADMTHWRAPRPFDLVVADPSRAGLARPGTAALLSADPRRIVLISCDVASLGRDAGLLVAGGYRLRSVTPVDMFPHSWHVEVVAIFDQQQG